MGAVEFLPNSSVTWFLLRFVFDRCTHAISFCWRLQFVCPPSRLLDYTQLGHHAGDALFAG